VRAFVCVCVCLFFLYSPQISERSRYWANVLASGRVSDRQLNTTQGRLAFESDIDEDHSLNGCTMIAYMCAIFALLGMFSSLVAERVIDSYCQGPLRQIRRTNYPNKGFVLVSEEEAIAELCERSLLPKFNASTFNQLMPSPVGCLCTHLQYRPERLGGWFLIQSLGTYSRMRIKCVILLINLLRIRVRIQVRWSTFMSIDL